MVAKGKNETRFSREGERELVVTRAFDAPARLVFEAWTKPELVARWWAPKSHGVTVASVEAEVREGGRYRYVMTRGGHEIAFSGSYREVTPCSRLVYTQRFEPMSDGGEALVTVTFEERAGKTHLTSRSLFPTVAALEAAIASGMEKGGRETLDQLEEVLALG